MTKYSNITPYAETNNFFAKQDLYENIKDFLHSEVIEVCFTKKNGDERKMLCTLMDHKIPGEMAPKVEELTETNDVNKDYMNVFDIEAKGWRSFILANVKYIKTDLNDYSA